jgi:small subunit ribosomal protein S15
MTDEKKPEWIKMKPAELEKIIVDLAKEGNEPAKIGLILRDKYAIPKAKLIGKKITKILVENNIKVKSEKEVVQSKIKKLESHIAKNHSDHPAKRSVTKKLWIVKKL